MTCQVCKSQSNGNHFGVALCRACAVFYRKTVVHKLVYQCKFEKKCQIQRELRKSCSFCRFEQCKAVGMSDRTIQLNRDKNGALRTSKRADIVLPEEHNKSPESSSSLSPSTNSVEFQFDLTAFDSCLPKTSLLELLQEGVKNYFDGEKFLHYMMYPQSVQQNKPILVDYDKLVAMDRGCLPLMQTLILQMCPVYQQMDTKTKIAIVQNFYHLFSPIQKCYTNYLYGNVDDEYSFIIHYGQYVTKNEVFYKTDKNPKYSFDFAIDCIKSTQRFCRQMRDLKLREIELGALLGIALANEVALIFKNDVMYKFREQIFDELHNDILKNYGIHELGPRIASFMYMLKEADLISLTINESISMRKLLNTNIMEVFEEFM